MLPSLATTLIPLPVDPELFRPLGIGAALCSMLCWLVTSMAFTTAGRRYGTTTVNVTRSVLAFLIILVAVRLMSGRLLPFPDDARIYWLVLSGIAGLAIGDQLIFSAFNRIGPRTTLLVLNLAPVTTALIAWPTLGEPLHILGWIGMGITIAGVSSVISERAPVREQDGRVDTLFDLRLGLTLALSGVLAVSVGNVLAKLGMLPGGPPGAAADNGIDPLIAQDVRMIAGAGMIVLMAAIAGATGRAIGTPPEPDPLRRPSRPLAISALCLGTILGPVLGIFFFLYSAALIEVGITATIVALTPVAILPFNRMIEGTPLTRRAIIGAVVGVVGVGVLAIGSPSATTGLEDALGRAPVTEALDCLP
jgi:drug/metabolite transporter (DMT)-like permease